MQRTAKDSHMCGTCGGELSVAWGGAFGIEGYILRCGNDIKHDTINRHDIKEEEYIKQVKEVRKMDSKSLMTMDEATMLQRVELAKFPQELDKTGKLLLAKVAITYGFDPLMGEVMIYQGRPYVSIDGRYRMAQETGNLDGVESRPANKEERDNWQIPEGDYFFRADVYVKGASRPFVGWGRVRVDERGKSKGFAPIDTNPQRMAEKRAEAQALRKAFHIPLPSTEDIGTAEDIPLTKVEIETGEILEAEPAKEKPEKIMTPMMKLSQAIKDTGYSMDEIKEHMKNKYGKEASKDLTKEELIDLTTDVANYQVAREKPQPELV